MSRRAIICREYNCHDDAKTIMTSTVQYITVRADKHPIIATKNNYMLEIAKEKKRSRSLTFCFFARPSEALRPANTTEAVPYRDRVKDNITPSQLITNR